MSDELDQNASFASLSPEAQQIVRQKLASLSPEAQQIVRQRLGGSASATTPLQKVPDSIKKLAQGAYAPFRFTRAIGAGAERLLAGQNLPILPSMVLDPKTLGSNLPQAAATFKSALQPGYQPQEGEKLGAFLGEAGGLTAATLPLGGIGAASLPLRVGIGAASAGGLTALQQASETGRVKVLPTAPKSAADLMPDSVVGNAITGGMLSAAPEIVQALRSGTKNAAMSVLPRLFAKTAGMPERSVEMGIQNPQLTRSVPDIENQIDQGTRNAMDALRQAKASNSAEYNQTASRFGIPNIVEEGINPPTAQRLIRKEIPVQIGTKLVPETTKDFITNIERTVLKPDEPLMGAKTVLKPGPEFVVKDQQFSLPLLESHAQKAAFADSGDQKSWVDLYKKYVGSSKSNIDASKISDADKVNILTQIKRELQSKVNFPKANEDLTPIQKTQNASIDALSKKLSALRNKYPGGADMQTADDKWRAIHEIYDTLQRSMSTEGKAGDELFKMFQRPPTGSMAKRTQEKLEAIQKVEQITGKPVLQPLMDLMTAREFGKGIGKGISHTALLAGTVGAAGQAAMTGHPLGALAYLSGAAASSPRAIGAGIRGATAAGRGMQAVANSPFARSALLAAFLSNKNSKGDR